MNNDYAKLVLTTVIVLCIIFNKSSYGNDIDSELATTKISSFEFYPLVEPSDYFHKARVDYLYNQNKAAGANIRRGARLLATVAERNKGDLRKSILASFNELNDLSLAIENGDYVSIKDMNTAFSLALFVLAKQELNVATKHMNSPNKKLAGESLTVAMNNLRHAYAWIEEELEDDYKKFEEIRQSANNLKNGVPTNVKKARLQMVELLDRLADVIIKAEEEENYTE